MEKKNFVALVLGVIGGLLFGIGMCMCLLPEWNMFTPGVVVTAIGLVVLVALVIVYRKMSGAKPIKANWKIVGKVLYGILSSLVLGGGMAFIMAVEGMMVPGIVLGVVGIVMLLFLIPMCLGFKDSKKEAVEETVVDGFTTISDAFIEKYLMKEGETLEEAKARINKEQEELVAKNAARTQGNVNIPDSSEIVKKNLEASLNAGKR